MNAHTFATLQVEFDRFCAIKDHPHQDMDSGQWEMLPASDLTAWAEQLTSQGKVVIDLFREMRECHFFAPYEGMKTVFRADVTDLQNSLRTHNIDLNFN